MNRELAVDKLARDLTGQLTLTERKAGTDPIVVVFVCTHVCKRRGCIKSKFGAAFFGFEYLKFVEW